MNRSNLLEMEDSPIKRTLYTIAWIALLSYLLFLFWKLLVYAYGPHFRFENRSIRYNLIPLKNIFKFLSLSTRYSLETRVINLVGNIIAFIPLGFLLPIVSRHKIRFNKTVAFCFLLSLFAESLQLILRLGSFDVDDLILNTAGGIAGYILLSTLHAVWKDHKVHVVILWPSTFKKAYSRK